eukprot:TRINITY_DN44516_c0_g1_i1.p1 TRINITY_DN44516_c0_g1~~TRINITY_DN44516_c0_g1_i1.p1  ORF type:complete len:274 (-),score=93.42 TRINITY_DN44516_c0_g1_i1:19-840(-)
MATTSKPRMALEAARAKVRAAKAEMHAECTSPSTQQAAIAGVLALERGRAAASASEDLDVYRLKVQRLQTLLHDTYIQTPVREARVPAEVDTLQGQLRQCSLQLSAQAEELTSMRAQVGEALQHRAADQAALAEAREQCAGLKAELAEASCVSQEHSRECWRLRMEISRAEGATAEAIAQLQEMQSGGEGIEGRREAQGALHREREQLLREAEAQAQRICTLEQHSSTCLLYTSDAADEEDSVDLGGRRILKQENTKKSEKGEKVTQHKVKYE